ncbi:MAG: site-2 protease family protein [Verrucomicrobiota bacterium]
MGGTSSFIEALFSSAWGIVLVLIFFNGSIIVHELGHYLAARWRGLKVERFSLFGLGPKLISWKGKDDVEYCICAIPFGAYVALPQLAEMRALEGDGDAKESLPPISYSDKMYVAFAGPFFNLILAIIVACVGWYVGYPTEKGYESPEIGYVYQELDEGIEGPAYKAGLRPGDVIVAVDGEPVEKFKQVPELVALGSRKTDDGQPVSVFTISRNGETKDITIYPEMMLQNTGSGDKMRRIGIEATTSLIVGGILENSPAERAGLQTGDHIKSIDGQPVYSIRHISQLLNERKNQKVGVIVDRAGEDVPLEIDALPVPITRPIARLTLPEEGGLAFEVIPLYDPESTADQADTNTKSTLILFSLEAGRSVIASDGDWIIEKINGQKVDSVASLNSLIGAANQSEPLEVTLNNGDVTRNRQLPAGIGIEIVAPEEKVMLGFGGMAERILVYQQPLDQFEEHIKRTFRTLGSLLSPSSDIGVRHLSGPVGITTSLYRIAQFDWRLVLWFAVLLNINLAILNLLPIPVLDGGHMMFATIGKVWGKPLPISFIANVQAAFMIVLLGVMFYVLYFDSMREVGYHEERQQYQREATYGIRAEFRPERYN